MNKTIKIVLVLVGVFIAYNIIVIAYAETQTGIMKVRAYAKYAPWFTWFVTFQL